MKTRAIATCLLATIILLAVSVSSGADRSVEFDRESIDQLGGRIVGQLETAAFAGVRFAKLGTQAAVALPTKGVFHPNHGTIRMRVRPLWSGNDGQAHTFFHLGDGNAHVTVFKTDTGSLRFVYKASPDAYTACDIDVTHWKEGEMHDIRAGWTPMYSGELLLQLWVDGQTTSNSGASVLDSVPEELFLGRRGLRAQPAEAWLGDMRISDTSPDVPYDTGPKKAVVATIDCSLRQPLRRVHDFTTIWNHRNNPVPFQVGDPEYERFRDAGFHMVRLVAFSESWLWGTRVEKDDSGKLVTDFGDFDRLLDVFVAAGAEPYIRLAYHTPSSLVDPILPRDRQRYALPSDLTQWDELMERIVRHVRLERDLPVRYWVAALNEGDIPVRRGQAKPETIYRLYERTAAVVKRLDEQSRVGGPALAWSVEADGQPSAMFVDFLKYCRSRDLPLDFICFHGYRKAHPRDYERLTSTLRTTVERLWPEKADSVEYFLDEWNLWRRDGLQDNEYGAAYLAAALQYQRRAGLTKSSIVSFNHFLPAERFVYDDQTIARFTGLPLIKGPVVTTPYFVWLMHNQLEDHEAAVELPGRDGILDDDASGVTATAGDKRIALLTWHFDLFRNEPRQWRVQLRRLPDSFNGASSVRWKEYRIDHDHNNPYTDYVLKNRPTTGGRYNLESAALDPTATGRIPVQDGTVRLDVAQPNMSVSLIELTPVIR